MIYNVVDLFAGPGGLGEGFTAFDKGVTFKIALSAEMDDSAHKTLLLRSFYRNAVFEDDKKATQQYFNWCNNSECISPMNSDSLILKKAKEEALKVTLGTDEGNSIVDKALNRLKLDSNRTILIGGPPCQAYSLVGRARNRGKQDYNPENDNRHFLYKQYLRIVEKTKPVVFILENVKGLLSSTIKGNGIFQQILNDLSAPGKAVGKDSLLEYVIYPLTLNTNEFESFDMNLINPNKYVLHSEDYGIPQSRHRIFLLGIRKDVKFDITKCLPIKKSKVVTLEEVINDLPRLRSRISTEDSCDNWLAAISDGVQELLKNSRDSENSELERNFQLYINKMDKNLQTGGLRIKKDRRYKPKELAGWYLDDRLFVHLNHESRSHMKSDLLRYYYSSVFSLTYGRSPKSINDFTMKCLRPNHKNWESGKFSDRFRVQQPNTPSSTITSHISKDGHYFIHFDPLQCRSLTVREAARLQTFPDNYFFQGNRTEQYHQVGNAVPPYLAYQIANIVSQILTSSSSK